MFGPILYRIVNVPRKNLSSPADKKSERFVLINFEQQGFESFSTYVFDIKQMCSLYVICTFIRSTASYYWKHLEETSERQITCIDEFHATRLCVFFISGETGKVDSLHTLIDILSVVFVKSRRCMAEILPIRRKTLSNQSLFVNFHGMQYKER